MKKIYQTILDFPQMVNQKIFNSQLNTAVDNFDSQNGIRCYTKFIYQILSILVLISLEVGIIRGAIDYFNSDSSMFGKVGSILTTLLLLYSAFPITQIIRSRGESLGNSHNGMVGFIFKDFVTTNIKILGEVLAVGTFFGAVCFGLSFLFDNDLFGTAVSTSLLGGLAWVSSLPMEGLNALLNALNLEYIAGVMQSITSSHLESSRSFNNDMSWNYHDLLLVAGGFINVMIGLAVLYVNLAIYNFLYNMIATFSKWIQNPFIPISTKNRS